MVVRYLPVAISNQHMIIQLRQHLGRRLWLLAISQFTVSAISCLLKCILEDWFRSEIARSYRRAIGQTKVTDRLKTKPLRPIASGA